ncbi:MAG: Gfo/Idh/MocA family oxidoreductase [Verrucomicrobiales bacterium]|nr:Gfo/Idh/MocA family oxidoreductase [Verrucomicrobiales bacterium]
MNDQTPDSRLAWGILGTGRIARTVAGALGLSDTSVALAVGSRTQDTAERFADHCGIERPYGSYERLLEDPDVRVVYIATPHSLHVPWAIRCAEAGKHILCEKPLALHAQDAALVVEAARRHDVFLMEAFMYRCHPQTAALVRLIQEGKIGEVRLIEASFGFLGVPEPGHRLFDARYGGGAILDVGCYPISMARLIAGVATGMAFAEPCRLQGWGHIGAETGVDEVAIANLEFPGGIQAQVSTAITVELANDVRVFGTEGSLTVPSPWFCGTDIGGPRILFRREATDTAEVLVPPSAPHLYLPEIDQVAAHLADREVPPPGMTWNDTLGNMRTLDRWLAEVGMRYSETSR